MLLIVPIAFTLLAAALVTLGISGTSSGDHWATFGVGNDPALIAGRPQAVRSDEWLVQSSWIVSQEQQGFPRTNETLPGGMDATVQNDLPSWDWSTIFRPHVAGFLILPLDQGMAIRWWLPALLLVIGTYFFVVTLLPRRPIVAVGLAIGMYFTPLVQWWFLPTTLYPIAWAFLGMAGIIWMLKDPRLWVRIVWAATIGYFAVTMSMSIYAPFIIPAAVVFALFALGALAESSGRSWTAWRGSIRRIVPLLVAGVGAAFVLGVWILTRLDTIKALFATVYPGQRFQATGQLGLLGIVSYLSAPFSQALNAGTTGELGPNQSEASSAILFAIFLAVPLLWVIVRDLVRRVAVDWLVVATLTATALITAFLLVPGWSPIAHLLLLDRSTDDRMRLGYAVLAISTIVVLVRRLDRGRLRVPWLVVAITSLVTGGSVAAVWLFLHRHSDPALAFVPGLLLITGLIVLTVVAISRRWVVLGTASFVAASVIIGAGVNPVYRGVFDLNSTDIGRAVARTDASNPGTWVGVGGYEPTAVLVESGVRAYNGVQTYPPRTMWSNIDPAKKYENNWNRLANVNWILGTGAPVVSNPVRDQIRVTFDSCSSFAQAHVQYVLSDAQISQPCVTKQDEVAQGPSRFWIYKVTPKPAG